MAVEAAAQRCAYFRHGEGALVHLELRSQAGIVHRIPWTKANLKDGGVDPHLPGTLSIFPGSERREIRIGDKATIDRSLEPTSELPTICRGISECHWVPLRFHIDCPDPLIRTMRAPQRSSRGRRRWHFCPTSQGSNVHFRTGMHIHGHSREVSRAVAKWDSISVSTSLEQ